VLHQKAVGRGSKTDFVGTDGNDGGGLNCHVALRTEQKHSTALPQELMEINGALAHAVA